MLFFGSLESHVRAAKHVDLLRYRRELAAARMNIQTIANKYFMWHLKPVQLAGKKSDFFD